MWPCIHPLYIWLAHGCPVQLLSEVNEEPHQSLQRPRHYTAISVPRCWNERDNLEKKVSTNTTQHWRQDIFPQYAKPTAWALLAERWETGEFCNESIRYLHVWGRGCKNQLAQQASKVRHTRRLLILCTCLEGHPIPILVRCLEKWAPPTEWCCPAVWRNSRTVAGKIGTSVMMCSPTA